jgi:hypothetical protein
MGKEEFELSHLVARKFCAGEIVSFKVHFDTQFLAQPGKGLEGRRCPTQIQSGGVGDFSPLFLHSLLLNLRYSISDFGLRNSEF